MKNQRLVLILCSILIITLARSVAPGAASGGQTAQRSATNDTYLAEFNSAQSEMRGMIETYVADRGSLFRFHAVDTPARNARFKQFYSERLAALGLVGFDSM